MRHVLLVTAIGCALFSSTLAQAQQAPRTQNERAQVLNEIQQRFGFVPAFVRGFPAEGLAGAWEVVKTLNVQPTAIPPKYKALIGIAVAAQVPCTYCLYMDKRAALSIGASEQELGETLAMAALTRQWSTVLNGLQIDKGRFRSEVAEINNFLRSGRQNVAGAGAPVTDARSAYIDIRRTLGIVPTFMQVFPQQSIAGAWREFKGIELNPDTAVPPRYKELIGLAVASQIPCDYCIHFHTEAARMQRATEAEIREAVALAAATRHWATYFDGMQPDMAQFRRDVDRMHPLGQQQQQQQQQQPMAPSQPMMPMPQGMQQPGALPQQQR